jgi:hypothetical protein
LRRPFAWSQSVSVLRSNPSGNLMTCMSYSLATQSRFGTTVRILRLA